MADRAFALDSSCVIAFCLAWHADHARIMDAIRRRLAAKQRLVLPVHVLLESFSVLTRMPAPQCLSPAQAEAALSANFASSAEVAALDGRAAWLAIRELASGGLGGGLLYDAIIAHTARQAGAAALLTLNVRHFRRLGLEGLEILEP